MRVDGNKKVLRGTYLILDIDFKDLIVLEGKSSHKKQACLKSVSSRYFQKVRRHVIGELQFGPDQ